MRNKIKLLAATSLSASLLFSGGFSDIVSAEEISQENVQLTQEQIDSIKSFFDTYQVDSETQLNLIERLSNGEVWDCFLNKEPINSYEVNTESLTENVDVFEDGSIVVSAIDLSEAEVVEVKEETNNNDSNGISPASVNTGEGSVQTGTGYKIFTNAKIYHKNALMGAHFYANFTLVSGKGSYISYIDEGYNVSMYTGYSNNESIQLVRANETSLPAEAILRWTYVHATGGGSTTCFLKLHLQNGNLTTPYHF